MGKSLGVDDARFPRPISRGWCGARDMTALLMHFYAHTIFGVSSRLQYAIEFSIQLLTVEPSFYLVISPF